MSFLTLSKVACIVGAITGITLVVASDMTAQRNPDFNEIFKVAGVSAQLTEEERALAVRLAEQALRSNRLLPDRKTFLTSTQTHRDSESEKKGVFERRAVLTYYRYAGDLGIRVYVNLARRRVTNVEQIPHFPAPLATEEFRLATELALNHPELKKHLEPLRDRFIVEAVMTRSPSAEDSLFRHRVVNLLFRVGPHYLTRLGAVWVDLTTERVIIKPDPGLRVDGHRK
jgi:hypothetical protein